MTQAIVHSVNGTLSSLPSKFDVSSSAGRTPAMNGHYTNGSVTVPQETSSDRIQIINDEKQFTPELTPQLSVGDYSMLGLTMTSSPCLAHNQRGKVHS
ncbi:hypothetical protein A0H81_09195 [Grifola frondosa]|uniref:Uncharacterized protein n=1 Tax=Grifola frondosa TaxID=5627 RepID=A0A1C7M2L5_GRIFR|nr:hypothetical protein A0H81_09195 [Grifola frondosa]